eukprot:UN26790
MTERCMAFYETYYCRIILSCIIIGLTVFRLVQIYTRKDRMLKTNVTIERNIYRPKRTVKKTSNKKTQIINTRTPFHRTNPLATPPTRGSSRSSKMSQRSNIENSNIGGRNTSNFTGPSLAFSMKRNSSKLPKDFLFRNDIVESKLTNSDSGTSTPAGQQPSSTPYGDEQSDFTSYNLPSSDTPVTSEFNLNVSCHQIASQGEGWNNIPQNERNVLTAIRLHDMVTVLKLHKKRSIVNI